ncbi:MAG: ATPase inhibitor subunit zeta [Pseudomonadota bacterium]|nr:ATPase inhibitor subunit zeta [Pseudomonadota bacterium]MED5367595.1 ATPase inhibitor subunit zeta [Pseudomonadota bacterium]
MSGFDEREKGQERKFAQDAELHFRARARRDKNLACGSPRAFWTLRSPPPKPMPKTCWR